MTKQHPPPLSAEERFRLLSESVTDYAFITFDPENGITSWSAGAEKLLGWKEAEVLGQSGAIFFTPEDRERCEVEKEIDQALRYGRAEDDRWHVRKDGSRFWASGVMTAVRDESGRHVAFAKVLRDLTERKRVEAAVRESEEIFRSALEVDTVGVIFFDAEGRYLRVNDAFLRMTGYTCEEIVDGRMSWRDITPSEWVPISERAAAQLQDSGKTEAYEKEYVRKDGSRIRALFAGKKLREGEFVEFMIDMTERQRAESALRESEQHFRLYVQNVQEYALFQTDPEGRVTSWNPGAERVFGYTSAEMLGQDVSRLLTPEDRAAEVFKREIGRVQASNQAEENARYLVRKDGSRFWAQWVTEPVHDEAGQLRGVAKVLRDETERKRAGERQLLLMGELNHRVKNTLATVQAMATQTLRGTTSPEEFVSRFKGRIQALSRSHNLLTRVRWEAADVADILREQLTFDGDAERISLNGPPAPLPASTSLALALVLHELGTNARKYGALSVPQGSLEVTWGIAMMGSSAKRASNDGEPQLKMEWIERGGPSVRPPEKAGFGTTLIAHSLRGVGGETTLHFDPDGLRCDIQLPVSSQDADDVLPKDTSHP